MSRADKKQRREAKRKAKKQEIRRRESTSPFKRLADEPGEIECWMSEGLEMAFQVQIVVHKRAAGLTGFDGFLIDQGIPGLKDAWTRLGMDEAEFKDILDRSRHRGIAMHRTTPEEARRLIAGGIRWAHQHGMRLPKDWTRTVSLLGGVGDWASADVSDFVAEFTGHPLDLQQRIIGEPFETYVQRSDIRFLFSDAGPYKDPLTGKFVPGAEWDDADDFDEDDDGDDNGDIDGDEDFEQEDPESLATNIPIEEVKAVRQQFSSIAAVLASETSTWLSARDETPSPELITAWETLMFASALYNPLPADDDDNDDAHCSPETVESILNRIEEDRRAECRRGIEQILEHLQTDPHMMKNAVLKYGLDDADEEATGDAPD